MSERLSNLMIAGALLFAEKLDAANRYTPPLVNNQIPAAQADGACQIINGSLTNGQGIEVSVNSLSARYKSFGEPVLSEIDTSICDLDTAGSEVIQQLSLGEHDSYPVVESSTNPATVPVPQVPQPTVPSTGVQEAPQAPPQTIAEPTSVYQPVAETTNEPTGTNTLPLLAVYGAGVIALGAGIMTWAKRSSRSETPPISREQRVSTGGGRSSKVEPQLTPWQQAEVKGQNLLRLDDNSAHTLGERHELYRYGPGYDVHPRDGTGMTPVHHYTDDPIASLKADVRSHVSLWKRLQLFGSYDHDPEFKENENRARLAARMLKIARGNKSVAAFLHSNTTAGRMTYKQADEFLKDYE